MQALGVAINTAALNPAAARDYLAKVADEMQLPAVDPFRDRRRAAPGRAPLTSRRRLEARIEHFPLAKPFTISRSTVSELEVVSGAAAEDEHGHRGCGEDADLSPLRRDGRERHRRHRGGSGRLVEAGCGRDGAR